MYLPALVAIAAGTNDVLTEPLWRHDLNDADDPAAHIARPLDRAAGALDLTAWSLTTMIDGVTDACGQHLTSVAQKATVHRNNLAADMTDLALQLEKFENHRDMLLTLYRQWRRYRPIIRDMRHRRLLVKPYEPQFGVVELAADETGLAWWVTADQVAAEAFTLAQGGLLGSIWRSGDGWQVTAFTDPAHLAGSPHLVHQLPPAATEEAACRTLLRWWAWCDSPTWRGRGPADLTAAERSALTA